MKTRTWRAAIAAAILFVVALQGAAQQWPSKPIRLVVPYAAGGGPDAQARQFAHSLSAALDAPVVVMNVVGAAGAVGAQSVQAAEPDGHTLLLGSSTQMVQKHMQPKLQFDPVGGFKGVS